jgi:hypothetical protein
MTGPRNQRKATSPSGRVVPDRAIRSAPSVIGALLAVCLVAVLTPKVRAESSPVVAVGCETASVTVDSGRWGYGFARDDIPGVVSLDSGTTTVNLLDDDSLLLFTVDENNSGWTYYATFDRPADCPAVTPPPVSPAMDPPATGTSGDMQTPPFLWTLVLAALFGLLGTVGTWRKAR